MSCMITSTARMWKLLAVCADTWGVFDVSVVTSDVVVRVDAPCCVSGALCGRMITFHPCHWPTLGALDNKSFNVFAGSLLKLLTKSL